VRIKIRRCCQIFKNFTLSMFIALASLFILTFGLFRSKSRVPSSIVFSLTSEQVFSERGIEDIVTSLKEKRFQDFFGVGNLLIEVRSTKSLLARDKLITFDAPFFLLTRCVKIVHYRSFVMKVFRSVIRPRGQELFGLKEVKRSVFDLAVYEVLHQHRYPEFDLVTTNSSLKKLPIAFQCPIKGRRVMVWYSTNSKPIYFRGNPQSLNWDVGAIIKGIDSHLVWTKYDVVYLESLGIHKAHAIGPILFQTQIVAEKSVRNYVITYFDVTPFAPSYDYIVGTQENFYSEPNALRDLEAIEKLSADLNGVFANKVQVRIKPKRAYSQMHSKEYITKIMEHSRQHQIEILSPYANLYEIISQSDLVIATPWTSPAVLAKEMSVNAVFFALRVADWDLPDEYEGIRVIKSLSEFMAFVNFRVQEKFNK
jgi:polysaccharide biosynthesis PFTS motif protein